MEEVLKRLSKKEDFNQLVKISDDDIALIKAMIVFSNEYKSYKKLEEQAKPGDDLEKKAKLKASFRY